MPARPACTSTRSTSRCRAWRSGGGSAFEYVNRDRPRFPPVARCEYGGKRGLSLFGLGGALFALRVFHVHLRVGAVGGGFGIADVNCEAHVGEDGAERRETQHHV